MGVKDQTMRGGGGVDAELLEAQIKLLGGISGQSSRAQMVPRCQRDFPGPVAPGPVLTIPGQCCLLGAALPPLGLLRPEQSL